MSVHGKLVAVRYLNKRLVKGWTADFWPDRDFFHLEKERDGRPTRIRVRDLKGIFFLKTLGRDPSCSDQRFFSDHPGAERKVWLEFRDGERLAGWSNSCGSPTGGFFVFPADPESNLEKAYVLRSALARLKEGAAAEEASRAYRQTADSAASGAAAGAGAGADTAESERVGSYRLGRSDLRGRGREKI